MPLALESTAEDKAYESQAKEIEKTDASTPEPVEAETKPEPVKDEVRVEVETVKRDDKGKFASTKEAEPEDKAEPEKPKEPLRVAAPKQVPVSAMLDERRQRQEYQKEVEALREWRTKAEKEIEAIRNPPKQAPDPNVDPDGFNRWKIEQLEQKVAATEQETKSQRDSREQRQKVEQRVLTASQYEIASLEEFQKARPDQYGAYQDAVEHYRAAMNRLLPSFGVKDPAVIQNTIDDVLLRAVEDARESGENAAERIWNLAGSLGFTGKPKAIPKPAEDEPRVEVTKEDPVQASLRAVEDKLGRLADGQRASKSIQGSSGKQGGLTLTELLASAKGASLFEETELDKVTPRQAKKLFGE